MPLHLQSPLRLLISLTGIHISGFVFLCYNPIAASTFVISEHASFLARSFKFSSVKAYLGVISLLHKEFSLPNPLSDNWAVKSLLTGIKRVKGDSVKQKLPITIDILSRVHKSLNLNSYDASFWAICLVAFFGLFRKSHLLPVSKYQYDSSKQFSKSSFQFYSWGALLIVQWSKTIQFRERTVHIPLLVIPCSPLCPVTLQSM